MSGTKGLADDWIQMWIQAQKTTLGQWTAAQSPAGTTGAGSFSGAFSPLLAAAQAAMASASAKGSADPAVFPWGIPGAAVGGAVPGFRDLPGIGPLREQQAAAQELAAALAEVERLSLEMTRVMAKVHADALDLLARLTAERANEGHPVADAKALYDLWVECGEATYAKVAHSDAYCRLQADLCNAAIRFQSVERSQMERWLKLLDLPTRSEVNTLNLRIRELARQVDTLAASVSSRAKAAATPTAARRNAAPKPAVSRVPTAARKRKPRSKA